MKAVKYLAIAAVSSISSLAFSEQFTYFSYQEGGYAGRMLVANELAHGTPVQPIAVHIQTVDTSTHHECDVWAMESTVSRIKSNGEISTSMRVVDENKKATGETFDVVIGRSGAVITSSTPSEYCGVSAMFSGHWVRSQEDAGGENGQEGEQDAL
ncbi:hypothetical protein [Pseudomonas guariconensis]|uniref:hypothetical protein n=1 Tax=Pseudomonas guariconensis TaxID=1288410 RepID=UPI0018AAF925|nr:hypothetical protein [Pseudomonas guariconensis]MBF8742160.1 hypothetical protein [Pseudomonas guariconensis]MBF8751292.1 hypothetical protein [Pseudomonas guariconensis]